VVAFEQAGTVFEPEEEEEESEEEGVDVAKPGHRRGKLRGPEDL